MFTAQSEIKFITIKELLSLVIPNSLKQKNIVLPVESFVAALAGAAAVVGPPSGRPRPLCAIRQIGSERRTCSPSAS